MDDLISKKDAIDAAKHAWAKGLEPSQYIEVIPPKRGHWMIEPTEEPEWCKCSECGYVNLVVEVFSLDGYHYCPNCGADMRGSENGRND